MLKNRLIYLALLLLLLIFRVAYTGYVAGMLLVIALILPVFSWIISLPGALQTVITLSAPDQVSRGSEATVTLSMRQSPLFSTGPVRGRLQMQCLLTGKNTYARLKKLRGGFLLDTSHCCQYQCSLRGFRLLDLLGLLPMPAKRPAPLTVTVMPYPQEPPEHPDWAGASTLVNKPFSGGENPYDLRDYRTGDTLKAIHWKKSAALDKTVVRDTLEPAERVAPIWIDWAQDPSIRDEALDQLAWCLIYLTQNNAGLYLQWLDAKGEVRSLYAPQGNLDEVMARMLAQRAGKRVTLSMVQPREILLTSSIGEGAGK